MIPRSQKEERSCIFNYQFLAKQYLFATVINCGLGKLVAIRVFLYFSSVEISSFVSPIHLRLTGVVDVMKEIDGDERKTSRSVKL